MATKTILSREKTLASAVSNDPEFQALYQSAKSVAEGRAKGIDYSKLDMEFARTFFKSLDDIKHGRAYRFL